MTEMRLEVPEGRVHEDRLGAGERALVDALAQLPDDRLGQVIKELVDIARVRVEVEILLHEGDGEEE